MSETFKVNYLLSEEIDYELEIRDIRCTRGLDDKRKILSRALKKKLTTTVPLENFNLIKEQECINKTLESIASLVIDFDGNESDSVFKRALSRLAHVSSRIKRIPKLENQLEVINKFKDESYATCLALEADLFDKIKKDPSDVGPPSTSTVVSSIPFGTQQCCTSRSVPVYK